ncbi:hypothetical protein QBC40DRAFT_47744 [Triangularia verruculosa]|uniref:Heterokaryon incompatibility domain-containing protein n=1 Tax=Triangularia verruculosa TaxID=2587418 RepID=A0AAN6XJQ3_9PEZI|nr:hypothetical protein QBC40DRAFT_47744 [Triangularia verruculosa]
MDFLPHPVAGVEPLDIPFVADTPFVFGTDFWDFPKLHGYGDQWASLPALRLASLAQSWLYFGTIAEFLGRPIDYREYQVSRSVTARPLIPLLNEWLTSHAIPRKDSIQPSGEGDEEAPISREARKRLIYEHAKFLDAVVDLAEDFDRVSQSHVKPIPTVVLSIKVLCTTLRSVLWDLVQVDAEDMPLPWPKHEKVATLDSKGNPDISPSAQLMLDVLRLRGWCPFYARKVLTSYNYAIAYYFTRLFRLFSTEVSHDGCSFDDCVASNADIFSYVPKHIRYGCQCQPMSVGMDQVRAIIEDGGVPLVRLRGSLQRGISLELVRMTARTRYVVVSHVWSDGIGNANANAMPECQLRRLFGYLSKLKPLKEGEDAGAEFNLLSSVDTGFRTATRRRPKYFWIDALCMPPVNTNLLRMRAINKLPAVYQAADRILVLDPNLEKISIANSDTLEQCARFSVSPWIGRSWTFQEAALGSVVEVQCADGTFNALSPRLKQPTAVPPPPGSQKSRLSELVGIPMSWLKRRIPGKSGHEPLQLINNGSTAGMGMDISLAMVASLTRCLNHEFRSSFANGVKPAKPTYGREILAPDFCTLFVQVWNELSERATTVPGDKHLIIANLLGFNTEPLMRLNKSAERMACILRSMDGVPMSLFFNMNGPRQKPSKNHRDRWVPLYPSKQKLTFGSTFTNLRNVKNDLYLPNNSVSRTKVAVLVCTGPPDPFSNCKFTVHDTVTGDQYSVEIHREDGETDAFATPEVGPYCIAIQLDNPMIAKQDNDIAGLAARPPEAYPGALFRVRRVVTKVKKLYYHALEATYEKSFELVEEDTYDHGKPHDSSNMRTTNYSDGDLATAFQRHPRGLLRTVYDCPLTITRLPTLTTPVSPSFRRSPREEEKNRPPPTLTAQPLPETWQVVIEREPPTYPVPLPTRPSFSDALTPVTAHLSVTALDGLVASGCVGFGIAICATMFPALAPLAKAAVIAKLILHSLFLIQMFVFAGVEVRLIWNVLHLTLVVLYTFSRVTQPGPHRNDKVQVLDWAFIAWSFVGHAIDFGARVVIHGVVVPELFEQYLASFDDNYDGIDGVRRRNKTRNGGAVGQRGLKRWWTRTRAKWRGNKPKVWVPSTREDDNNNNSNENDGGQGEGEARSSDQYALLFGAHEGNRNSNANTNSNNNGDDDMDAEFFEHEHRTQYLSGAFSVNDGYGDYARPPEVHMLGVMDGRRSSSQRHQGKGYSTLPI